LAEVRLQGISKIFNRQVEAVKDLNMIVEDKKVVCLLGPSGCGKTTTVRIIAGLEEPTTGEVYLEGKEVTYLSPSERDVAMVFQFPAVYPNLSVYDNLAFPLRGKGLSSSQIDSRVKEVAKDLQVPFWALDKRAGTVDPGLRQKVAIGRAIVRKPKAFLFDEPLTNLDATTRTELMGIIKHLSREVGQTFVYVTHDQSEAMSLADKIGVMKDGSLIQYDEPDIVYEWPKNKFVGWFLGNPGMNFITGVLFQEGENLWLSFGKDRLEISKFKNLFSSLSSSEVILGIRPEYVEFVDNSLLHRNSTVSGICSFTEFLGGRMIAHIKLGEDIQIRVKDYPRSDIRENTIVSLNFPENKLRFFTPEGIALG